jgi:peptidoglycan/LPS O-acetylase OafA/YrhL
MKTNYPALTGIRAIAAYMVFLHHFDVFSIGVFGTQIHDFFREFHIGVTIFFVLSGFLICNRYYEDFNFSFKSYFIKRFARIYPMYFGLTTISFLFYAILHSQSTIYDLKLYLLNISFFRGYFDDLKFTGIAQGWSLTVEESFYLLAPLFFILIRKRKINLIIIPIFFIILGFCLIGFFQNYSFHGLMNTNNFMLDFTIFGRISEFFIGILLAIFINKINIRFKHITILGIFFILLSIYILSIIKPIGGNGTDCVFGKIINTFLLPLFGIAPLFYGLIKETTVLSKTLSSKIFTLLGKSSYIFYLIHMGFVINILNKITQNYVFIFISLNIIAVVLYQFIEKPLNNYIRKWRF